MVFTSPASRTDTAFPLCFIFANIKTVRVLQTQKQKKKNVSRETRQKPRAFVCICNIFVRVMSLFKIMMIYTVFGSLIRRIHHIGTWVLHLVFILF